ncbi:Zn-dependent exopeptidase [Gymnopus androsaceus JB14]|uniref:Peptide hydrolase n=1 Tax=Gymnopus androsaceus JB14 TaxID=1447944 RepID=A0A6A4GIG9_9AGAR|nr:Zn-dependent exopeptidase [Gymnopus androsaceus JB14]
MFSKHASFLLSASILALTLGASAIPSSIVESNQVSFSLLPNNDNGLKEFDFDASRLVRFFSDTDNGKGVVDRILEAPVWVTEREKLDAKSAGRGYIDITDLYPDFGHKFGPTGAQHVYHPPNSSAVSKILPLLSSEVQRTNSEIFTTFHTRYYNSDTGHASSRWLYERALNYTDEYDTTALRAAVRIELVLQQHAFKQESVIIRLTPRNSSSADAVTIIGAHCDSINDENPFFRSPGADDDGSGTITVLEAFRGILRSGYIPTSPLEFHFYAGEEGGLLGSLDISDGYKKAGKNVRGMMEFDMTAWIAAGRQEEIGIVMNQADPALSEYTKLLIEKHLDIPWVETKYPGRAGSDYMSWTIAGYQSAHVLEGAWEGVNFRNHHQATDTIDVSPEFSFDHVLRFTKLAVAFAVELSDY